MESCRSTDPVISLKSSRYDSDPDFLSLDSGGQSFADAHAIPFIETLPSRPSLAPFTVLLNLVRRHHEPTTSSITFGEGIIDFVTVAAAKVSHAARSHLPALPTPHVSTRNAESRTFLSHRTVTLSASYPTSCLRYVRKPATNLSFKTLTFILQASGKAQDTKCCFKSVIKQTYCQS